MIRKLTDGLFLNVFRQVASQYSALEANDMIVDNASMQLVSNPQQFDVIVTPNLYGNIISNIGAGLVGSPALIPGYSIGADYATFEPGCRHVGLDIQGRDCANPISMLLSGCFMLDHLGLHSHAQSIRKAIEATVGEGKHLTPDLQGKATTTEMCNAIIGQL